MKTKITALVLGLSLCLTSAFANKIAVTVGSDTYYLTTIEGSFAANETQLKSQVWWQNDSLIDSLIAQVQGRLGYPIVGSGNLSPFFAVGDGRFSDPTVIRANMWRESDNSPLILAIERDRTTIPSSITPSPVTWIVAAVPEGGATLAYVAMAMSMLLFRRKALRAAA